MDSDSFINAMAPVLPSPAKSRHADGEMSEDEEDFDYEEQRLRRIAANEALLNDLGLTAGVSALTGASLKPEPKQPAPKRVKPEKRKREVIEEDNSARRRSSRLAGLEADGEKAVEKQQQEETAFAQARAVSKRLRAPKMAISDMVEASSGTLGSVEGLHAALSTAALSRTPRPKAPLGLTDGVEKKKLEAEEKALVEKFKKIELKKQVRVTQERVYSIAVHPMPTKTLVFVGDKRGQLGIWDADAPEAEPADDDAAPTSTPTKPNAASTIRSSPVDGDETLVSVKEEVGEKADNGGNLWRMQLHSTNSISCLKLDPVDGGSLYSTSYDCSLRRLSLLSPSSSSASQEIYKLQDEDALLNSFDVSPDGKQAWLVDSRGGLSHVDLAGEGNSGKKRRWVVSSATNNAMKKLGGVSINPALPWLMSTAGNDRYLRLWDTRHFSQLKMQPYSIIDTAPSKSVYDELPIPAIVKINPETHTQALLDEELDYEAVFKALSQSKHAGMFRGEYFHGKSCSSAYWDPWGRKVLTTSYDDKLRVFDITREQLAKDAQIPGGIKAPSKVISHDCQCGRWVSVLKAQWSMNVDYAAHFTVGNMARKLTVYSASGTLLANLSRPEVTAVPAVTQQHPSHINHLIGGNASGKCQFWGPRAE